MKKYTPSIIFLVIAVIIILLITFMMNDTTPVSESGITATSTGTSVATTTQKSPATSTPTAKLYSMAEVSIHSTQTSCWTTINGGVYDVTSWISKHPGGARAILKLCGKDGTTAFTGQHGGQSGPEQALATFKIGTLSK